MSTHPKISIIFGTYNQLGTLQKVLREYEFQTLPPDQFEVIVIDSSSTDGTTEWIAQYRPNFQFRGLTRKNEGKAAARNVGVTAAKGGHILITDADMIPDPKLIETHLTAQLATQAPTCFEGLTYNMTHYHWPPKSEAIYPYITRDYSPGKKLGWYYFLTGNISFPKSIFLEENGFSTDFKGYGWEDLELGYRFQQKKIPLYYLPQAVNYHYHVVTDDDEISRCKAKGESAKVMLQKHPELKWFMGLNPLSVWLHPKISPQGRLYQWIQTKAYPSKNSILHKFGKWFLSEHHYLSGLLSQD